MISTFIDWLVGIIQTVGYPGIAFAVFLESFFAPIPSEIILPFSGFVAARDSLSVYIVILVAIAGAYLGTLPFYFIGLWGEEHIKKFLDRYGKYLFISNDDLQKGYDSFEKYGSGIVFFGRMIPIVRTVISFPAGAAHMKFGIFSLYTLGGTFIWTTLLVGAGYLLGDSWETVGRYLEEYENIVLIVLGILFVLYILRGLRKTLNRSN